jgi:hypothetical protein
MSGRGPLHSRWTSLADEGFGEVGAERLIEGFARHLMVAIDRWQEGEFSANPRDYLTRLRPEPATRLGIDASGNLRIERPGGEQITRLDLRAALATPSWLE